MERVNTRPNDPPAADLKVVVMGDMRGGEVLASDRYAYLYL